MASLPGSEKGPDRYGVMSLRELAVPHIAQIRTNASTEAHPGQQTSRSRRALCRNLPQVPGAISVPFPFATGNLPRGGPGLSPHPSLPLDPLPTETPPLPPFLGPQTWARPEVATGSKGIARDRQVPEQSSRHHSNLQSMLNCTGT